MALYPEILETIKEFPDLSENRIGRIQPLLRYLEDKRQAESEIRLLFVCTHNSRRSILSQVWAQSWAHHFGFRTVTTYSAGTESTEIYPRVLHTLQKQGLKTVALSKGPNAVAALKFAPDEQPIIGFSKSLSHPVLPESAFAAIMTCNQASEQCPLVSGAETRFALTYEDPKVFDHTKQAPQAYAKRSLQIASEWYFVFQQLKNAQQQ